MFYCVSPLSGYPAGVNTVALWIPCLRRGISMHSPLCKSKPSNSFFFFFENGRLLLSLVWWGFSPPPNQGWWFKAGQLMFSLWILNQSRLIKRLKTSWHLGITHPNQAVFTRTFPALLAFYCLELPCSYLFPSSVLACLLTPVVLPTNFLFLKINQTNFCCFHPKHPKCIRNEWDRPNLSFQNLSI